MLCAYFCWPQSGKGEVWFGREQTLDALIGLRAVRAPFATMFPEDDQHTLGDAEIKTRDGRKSLKGIAICSLQLRPFVRDYKPVSECALPLPDELSAVSLNDPNVRL